MNTLKDLTFVELAEQFYPSQIKERAIANFRANYPEWLQGEPFGELSPPEALISAFPWDKTPEGAEHWCAAHKIFQSLEKVEELIPKTDEQRPETAL